MKQADRKKYGILAGMFLVLLLAHALIRADFGDDLAYQNILDNQSMFDFLRERYYTWSSRVLIEAVMLLFVTGITADPDLITFIVENGCPAYFQYSGMLLYNKEEKDLRKACLEAVQKI